MDTIHIVNLHAIFAENAHCLSIRLGVDVVKDFNPISGHTYIIFAAHEQAPTLYECQIALGKEGKPFKFIIINGEPPTGFHLRNKFYIGLMRNNVVWDYHQSSTAYLTSLGIRVYSQYCFEFIHYPIEPPQREVDIMFVGSHTPRREAVYKLLTKTYPEKTIIFNLNFSHTNHEVMTKELKRAKVVLNIPYYDHDILETHRINKALACGCKVVALYSGNKKTDDFYAPYVYFTHDFLEMFDGEGLNATKLGYQHLINALNPSVQHNKWVLKQLIKN
jgi:hypothetical protein